MFLNTCFAKPLIVAHRGASFDAPENTLPAFELAWEQGADAIEGDFLLTKDKQIVCIHDQSTKRLADRDLEVKSSTLAELKSLDVGFWKDKKYKNTRIPTLAEVLATIPDGKKIFVEIKCGTEIIPFLIHEIEKSGLHEERIVIICFKHEVIQALKNQAPQYIAHWLSEFRRNDSGEWTPSLETVLNKLKKINADGLDSHHGIPREFSQEIMEAGYEWHVWTVNDEKLARKMKDMGVFSITTDRPEWIRKSFH